MSHARSKKPLYLSVYHALRRKILSGDYSPGTRIGTEVQLAEDFGASLITIRQAQQMLVEEGLLIKRQRHGTFVPGSAAGKLSILGVCGLNLLGGTRQVFGSYFADLLLFSSQEAVRRGLRFETVWIPTGSTDQAKEFVESNRLDEFIGAVFFGRAEDHPVLREARERNMCHACLSPRYQPHNTVWLDYSEAVRKAIGVFSSEDRRPVLVMGIENQLMDHARELQEGGLPLRLCGLPAVGEMLEYEILGYQRMRELIGEGADCGRILLLDDVIARGATRAMLEAGLGKGPAERVVICGKQEIIPLGLDVTFVSHDTREEVAEAFSMLDRQRPMKRRLLPSSPVPFAVMSPEEVEAMLR